jgi:hypothetical protein
MTSPLYTRVCRARFAYRSPRIFCVSAREFFRLSTFRCGGIILVISFSFPALPNIYKYNENRIMKPALKATALAVAALACGAIATEASQAQPAPSARSAVVTEQRPVGAFNAIEVAGPWRVVIQAQAQAQGRPALELSGERKQLDEIETVVRGDTLVVRPVQRKGFVFTFNARRHETPVVRISAAALRSLKMSGSGDVELTQLASEQFEVNNSGPGDLQASGSVRRLTVNASGSGDLDLRRLTANDVKLDMHGAGDVRLADIKGELTAQLSGSGDLTAEDLRATRVEARMQGAGDVTLSGSSRALSLEVSGSGDFEGCGLAVEDVRSVQRGAGSACVGGRMVKFDAQVYGSGDLTVRGLQAQAAQMRMNGPGNVKLEGSADDLYVDLFGSGDLEASIKGKRLQLVMRGPGNARVDGSVDVVEARLSGSGRLEGRGLTANQTSIAVRGPGNATVNMKANAAQGGHGQLLLVDRNGSRQVNN